MSGNKRLLIGGLFLLAAGVGMLVLKSPRTVIKSAEHPAPVHKDITDFPGAAPEYPSQAQNSARSKADFNPNPVGEALEESGSKMAPSSGAASESESETPREQAVRTWELLVDQMMEQTGVPSEQQARQVKEAFDKLDKEDQMAGIHRGLNLLPDAQFPALYAILYDKMEDPEVLDAIFCDALNRPEKIKNPLLKELRRDPRHPMFFESARILDMVGPDEDEP